MNQVQIRSEVHQMVDRLDEHLLAAVHSMLATYEQKQEEDTIIGYNIKGVPQWASQLRAELLREIELVEQGNFMRIEDLEKLKGVFS
jgi:orotate phosphoribosyltransferase-like protein